LAAITDGSNIYDGQYRPGSPVRATPADKENPPGRKYEQTVKAVEPYDSIKEENPEARAAGEALIAEGTAAGPKRRTFVFVNNRLEGNAISTITAMLEPE
jgi:hypothetical protein